MPSRRLDHSLELDDLALQDKQTPAFMLRPRQESYIQCVYWFFNTLQVVFKKKKSWTQWPSAPQWDWFNKKRCYSP